MVHRPRPAPGVLARLLALAAVLALALSSASPASAAIFARDKLWPPAADGSGLTIIPVCIADDSDATQKATGVDALLPYDPNPTLADVVLHVRAAIEASWESVSAVRFVDWRMCSALDAGTLAGAVQVYIHPNAANASSIGTDTRGAPHGVNFKPWASANTANLCITFDSSRFRMKYDFSCVEQYSIHEFGHALGFLHEWYNPATPAACTQTKQSVQPGDWGPPLAGYQASCLGGGSSCTTVNPTTYDDRSIMTYDSPCANVHGVRFGSVTLDHWDALGAWVAYPTGASGDTLASGFGLLPGGTLRAPGGQYRLTFQADGNLVLYDAGGRATWATGTFGEPVDYAVMQTDGNLVLYGGGAALWASGTSTAGARLVMQDDGNLVQYGLAAKWSSGTNQDALLVGLGGLGVRAGQSLAPGQSLSSPNGRYTLAMQGDGNLVVYQDGVRPLWASGTDGNGGASSIVQPDGNYVVYSAGGSALWSSATFGETSRPLLLVQDDGNAVLYGETAVWSTGTN